jgi:hypothetical protein
VRGTVILTGKSNMCWLGSPTKWVTVKKYHWNRPEETLVILPTVNYGEKKVFNIDKIKNENFLDYFFAKSA